MAFWKVDLTTEDGALGAAQLGGYACFVAAALSAFGLLIVGWYLGTPDAPAATMVLGVAAAETVLFAVAGSACARGAGWLGAASRRSCSCSNSSASSPRSTSWAWSSTRC